MFRCWETKWILLSPSGLITKNTCMFADSLIWFSLAMSCCFNVIIFISRFMSNCFCFTSVGAADECDFHAGDQNCHLVSDEQQTSAYINHDKDPCLPLKGRTIDCTHTNQFTYHYKSSCTMSSVVKCCQVWVKNLENVISQHETMRIISLV